MVNYVCVNHRFARSAEIIAIFIESVAEVSNVTIPRRSHDLELSYSTLWCILHLDLHPPPFKI